MDSNEPGWLGNSELYMRHDRTILHCHKLVQVMLVHFELSIVVFLYNFDKG